VGGKNSAAEAASTLRAGASVTLVHRRAALGESIKYWVRPDIENRIQEGSIAARFNARVTEIRPTSVVIERHEQHEELPADAVLLLTGYHSDVTLFESCASPTTRTATSPHFNPETFESNVEGLYLRQCHDRGQVAGSSSKTGGFTASR